LLLDLEALALADAGALSARPASTLAQHFVVADRQLTRSEMWATVLPGQLLFHQPVKKDPCTLWDPQVHYLLPNSSTTYPIAEPHQSNPHTPLFSLTSLLILCSHLGLGLPVCSLPFPYRHLTSPSHQANCPKNNNPARLLSATCSLSEPEALSSHTHFRCGGVLRATEAHPCHGSVTDRPWFSPRQASSCAICGGQSGTETGSPPSSSDFLSVSIITQQSILNFILVQLLLEGQAGDGREI